MGISFLDYTWVSALLTVILVYILFYWYTWDPNAYWKKLGIPFIPAKPLIGSISLFSKRHVHELDVENYKKYGRLYGSYDGKQAVLTISNPDLIRNVFVKDFPVFTGRRGFKSGDPINDSILTIINGEKWKRIRCIISPAFSTGKIKRMTDIILSCAKTVVQNFAGKGGKPIDAKELFSSFTMDVIASAAFATKIHSYNDPTNRFVQTAKTAFRANVTLRLIMFVVFPKLMKFFRISFFPASIMDFFKNAVLEIIADRRKHGISRNDFLQLMIDAEKECHENDTQEKSETNTDDEHAVELGHDENNAEIFKSTKSNKYLSADEMIAQCVLFFLAGFETTATTLTFSAYMLALHPEIQDKLSDEVDAVIRNHDGKLTYEAIQEMKYLDKVLSETLRKFPPLARVERVADADYTFENTNITITKGTVVSVPVYALHQDPKFYPEPEKFNPERFSAEEKHLRHSFSYLAFGAGPRNCVAMRFALMEVKLCLAYLVSQLRIKSCKETMEPLNLSSGIGILQPKNIMFCVEKRENRVFDGL